MKLFSERHGYIKPSDALIVECMPKEVQNSIYNCLYNYGEENPGFFESLDKMVWVYFLNEKECTYDQNQFNKGYITLYIIDNSQYEWHLKLSMIEYLLELLEKIGIKRQQKMPSFIDSINMSFERLKYGYRIINNLVTPITSKEEVSSIEEALYSAKDNIKEHLNSALKHLADKENPDYRNSIKESISAVGALCREMTAENDLGKALFVLEKKQGKLHPQLKAAFDNLYSYVNEKQSGIRHELMDERGVYVPTFHEAKFMLVTCSAFINYLNGRFN